MDAFWPIKHFLSLLNYLFSRLWSWDSSLLQTDLSEQKDCQPWGEKPAAEMWVRSLRSEPPALHTSSLFWKDAERQVRSQRYEFHSWAILEEFPSMLEERRIPLKGYRNGGQIWFPLLQSFGGVSFHAWKGGDLSRQLFLPICLTAQVITLMITTRSAGIVLIEQSSHMGISLNEHFAEQLKFHSQLWL